LRPEVGGRKAERRKTDNWEFRDSGIEEFKINDSKGEYAIYFDAVYNS